MVLGSRFYKEVTKRDDDELSLWSMRTLIGAVGFLVSFGISAMFLLLDFPTWIAYLLLFFLLTPTMIIGFKMDKRWMLQERIRFVLVQRTRRYQTELILSQKGDKQHHGLVFKTKHQ